MIKDWKIKAELITSLYQRRLDICRMVECQGRFSRRHSNQRVLLLMLGVAGRRMLGE